MYNTAMVVREALLRADVASATQIDEALARQQLYGADIVTNLLELVELDESVVQRTLGEAYGMPLAPSGELPYAAAAAIELVPRNVATELNVYPYRLEGSVLTLVAAAPLSERAAVDLGFALKVQVRALFAIAPRIKHAISRDYAFAMDKRTIKAIAKLERASRQFQSELPPAMPEVRTMSQFPRPRSIVPFGFPENWSDAVTPDAGRVNAVTARQPEVRQRDPNDLCEPPETSRSIFGSGSEAPEFPGTKDGFESGPASGPRAPASARGAAEDTRGSRQHRRRGPYTVGQAKKDLGDVLGGDEVLEVFFDFAAQFFDYTAAFVPHSDQVDVREARGRGRTLDELPEWLPLAEHPALLGVTQTRSYTLLDLGEKDPTLAQLLMRDTGQTCLLLPITVRNRAVVILYGGFDSEPVELPSVGDLIAFCPLVSRGFERAILARRANTQLSTGDIVGFRPKRPRFERPTPEDRAVALANLLNEAGD